MQGLELAGRVARLAVPADQCHFGVFGIVMFAWPGVGVLTVIYLVGIYAIVEDISLCLLAFQARRPPVPETMRSERSRLDGHSLASEVERICEVRYRAILRD